MEKITTIGELRKSIEQFNEDDIVVVEIHDGERYSDLYQLTIDVIDGIKLVDGTEVKEVRLCI